MQRICTLKIDVGEVLRNKAGRKAGRVPRFVVAWLKRIIHQNEINVFLEREGDKQGVPWLNDCVDFLGMRLDVKGIENLPPADNGRLYTFVSNHPLGGQAGVASAPCSEDTTTAG